MKKKWISLILFVCLLLTIMPVTSMAATNSYTDILADHWSVSVVYAARNYELMQGTGDGVFGFGNTITRAGFITVLDRMFGWETLNPDIPTFSDVTADQCNHLFTDADGKEGRGCSNDGTCL